MVLAPHNPLFLTGSEGKEWQDWSLLVSATVEVEHQLLLSSLHEKPRPCNTENTEYISTQMNSFTT